VTASATSGRRWAYTGAILGGVASIAANVAHSFIPPEAASQDWTPEAGAVVGAIVWPVFLFVAVEIFARVLWPHGRPWKLLRWAGILPVAAVAALVSYRHLSGLLHHYGEEPIVTVLGPLAVDGLMVMATGALIATGHRTTEPVSSPAGVAASDASAPTTVPSHVDTLATPASSTDPAAPTEQADPVPATTSALARPPVVPSPTQVAARITGRTATADASDRPVRSAARTPGARPRTPTSPPATPLAASATDSSVSAPDAAKPSLPVVPPAVLARASQVARQYRTEHGTPITAGQLAVRLKVTSEQATQVLAVLDLAADAPTRPVPTVNGQPVKARR
jgi:hypothetical protein